MELYLPKRGVLDPQFDRVTKRLRDANDLPTGKSTDKPFLDTRMCKV